MQTSRRAIGVRWTMVAAACATATALGVAGCGTDTTDSADRLSGTVRAVPSGDSVTLIVDGAETSFDLAYLEAPKSDSDQTDSCLDGQSTAELRRNLPTGGTVTFEEADYGILVYDEEGRLVNAAPVRAGLALIPAESEDSPDVPSPMLAALEEARSDRVGLHGTALRCTAPSMLVRAGLGTECLDGGGSVGLQSASPSASRSSATTTTSTSSSGPPAAEPTSTELKAQLAAADVRWEELARFSKWIHDNRASVVWRALSATQGVSCQDKVNSELGTMLHRRATLAQDLDEARAREAEAARLAEEQRKSAEAARVAEEQRLAAEAEAARVAEEQRKAAEAAEAARIAEEQRIAAEAETARIAAEAEADRLAQTDQSQSRSGSGSSGDPDNGGSNSSSNGGYTGNLPGYNGPRCYAPGGQTWRPC